MHTLVVFFSLSGKTKKVAEALARLIGADLEELVPEKEYRKIDMEHFKISYLPSMLGYGFAATRGKQEKVLPLKSNPVDYERIVIGTPTWNANPAPPVNYFIEENIFLNKEVDLFVLCRDKKKGQKVIKKLKKKLDDKGGKVMKAAVIEAVEGEMLEKAQKFADLISAQA